MKLINIDMNKYFHMIPLWKSPIKLPVELPAMAAPWPACSDDAAPTRGATRCKPGTLDASQPRQLIGPQPGQPGLDPIDACSAPHREPYFWIVLFIFWIY